MNETELPVVTEEVQQVFVNDYIEAGLRVVLSDETVIITILAAIPFLTLLIIVIDYFNRKGRRF